jgi:hypothetical protein
MTRAASCSAVLLVLSLAAGTAEAQRSPAPIRYGKWALLAGSVGLNIVAADAHRDADRIFDELEQRCTADQTLCAISGAQYTDATTEALYQETLRLDRRSRTFLFGGEAAFLGAAALFIWEFARPKSPPGNVPFEPEVSVRNGQTRLGVRIGW